MDIFVLKALADDLQQRLSGAVVSKVFQMSATDLLLRLWRHQDLRLLLCTHAAMPRLHLTTSRFSNPRQPPRFAAFLRAHLQHARLHTITVQPYDRIISLTWERPDAPTLTLIHELTGALSNLIVVDTNGLILEALKRVPPHAPYHRPIQPGCPYAPVPSPPHRVHLSALTREHLEHLHQQGQFDTLHVQRLIVGLSSVLAAELVHRSHGEANTCWDLLQDLRHHYEHKTLSLTRCTLPDGTQHISALPLTHCATTVEPFVSAQEAVAAFYQPLMQTTLVETKRREAQKIVRQRQQKLRKKIANLQRDHQKLQDYLPYQHYGTLLVAQHLPRGTTSATVVDYYSPEPSPITIPLDPRLSVRDNAQVYFKKYRKAKSGLAKVQALLDQCTAEEQALAGVAQQIAEADDWHTLQTLETKWRGHQPAARRQYLTPTHTQPPPAQPYRSFTSRDGLTLYCGKSSQGNDALLRQLAAPEDLWFHAHQHAGAHVLLKVRPQQEVSQQTLVEAAALAAFYSKGKDANAVEVIYTQAKHVRKFRGARPGQVLVQTYRALEVSPQRPDSSTYQAL